MLPPCCDTVLGCKGQEQLPRRGTDLAPKETFLNCLARFPSSIINLLYLPAVIISIVFHSSNANGKAAQQQVCRRDARVGPSSPSSSNAGGAGAGEVAGGWEGNPSNLAMLVQLLASCFAPDRATRPA